MGRLLLSVLALSLAFCFSLEAQQNQYYLSFDGNDYVKYFNDSYLQRLDGATDYTLEAWIKPDSTVEKYDRVFQRYYSFNVVIWHVTADSDSCDWYFTGVDNGGNAHYFNAKQSIAFGQWNHIAVINNSTEGYLKLFVNGQDVTTENYANFTLRDAVSNDNFYVGQKGNGTDYFDGAIDEVRLKNVAENPDDLNQNINQNYVADQNTALLLHFDEGEGYHWTWNAASENDSARLGGTDAGDEAEPTWMKWIPAAIGNQWTLTVPEQFYLKPNYPNPFNPVTTIPIYMPVNGEVLFSVFDASGRQITQQHHRLHAGLNRIRFNGQNLSSGIYLYRVQFQEKTANGKMLLVR